MTRFRSGTPEEVGMSPQRVYHISDLVQDWSDQGVASPIAVMVARKGVVILEKTVGSLRPEPDSPPFGLDSIYPLISMSKLFTIMAAMVLVEDGLLSLNRPVSHYIPGFTGEGKQAVMVHHLLTYTSGIDGPQEEAHAEKKKRSIKIPSPAEGQHPQINEFLFLRYDAPLSKSPGSEMVYGNVGIEILGEIVRRVSGKPLADFTRERIFEPLGMKDTSFGLPKPLRPRIVKRPADAPYAELFEFIVSESEIPWASRGAFSTAKDIAIFGQMFLNRGWYGETRIFSPVAITEMTRNQIPGIGAQHREEVFPEASWGFGWNVHGHKKALGDGSLQSPQAFYQGNAGGILLWVDPVYEIVGVYWSVALHVLQDEWPGDLFMNAVTAAIIDV